MGATSRYVERVTTWTSVGGDVTQVSVALLDEVWEPQAVVTEHVGPFDDVAEVLMLARQTALNLARRQLAGQLSMLPD